jgi:hypothetical protein
LSALRLKHKKTYLFPSTFIGKKSANKSPRLIVISSWLSISGTLGSGLVLMSRFPILSSAYLKFTLAGRPLKIFQGDYYVGKGCGSVCIDHPDIGLVDVFTTHVNKFCHYK